MTQNVFTVAMVGASDISSYNNRNWPILLANTLQVGRSSFIRTMLFGTHQGSTVDLSSGTMARLASMRADAAVLSFYADADPNRSVTAAQSLANMYTTIDMIRAARADTQIFLIKTWKLQAATEADVFPTLANYWAQYATASANRGVGIIDGYTDGDPTNHPEDYSAIDPIHPLVSYYHRVTIPKSVASLGPLVL